MGFERNRILVGNTHATKLDVFLSGEDETSNFMWHCDQQGLLDADESFGFTDFSWVSDAVGIWPRLTYDLFCTPREKRRDPIQQWCRCDSCLWRVWFLLRCFKFWGFGRCRIHTWYIYIHLVYIIICITQIVYSPHKPYCVMAWCQWTFLCLGICCVNPMGFEFGSPQKIYCA